MIPGFKPVESAVAACLVDDLADSEGASAVGIGLHMYRKHARRLRARFRVTSRQSLRLELFDVERSDIEPLGRALSTGEPQR